MIKDQKGVTLLETILAVSVLVILLPVLVLTLLRLNKESSFFSTQQRIINTQSLVFSELSSELISAQAVNVAGSIFGINPSSLIFNDQNGLTVTIDCPNVSVSFPGGPQTVHRLRLQRSSGENIYLTDADLDVTNWTVYVVRNSDNLLTGLRFLTTFSIANKEDLPFRNLEIPTDFTIALPGSVQEL